MRLFGEYILWISVRILICLAATITKAAGEGFIHGIKE